LNISTLADNYLKLVRKMKVRLSKIVNSTCWKEPAKELIVITAKISLDIGKRSDLLKVKSIYSLSVTNSMHRRLSISTMWPFFGETF